MRENVIRMQFIVRQRSKDTAVYKVGAFKFWDNLTEIPALKEYRGHRFLIYNRKSNYLKAIDEPSQLAVIEECDQANFTDSRLQIWETLVVTRVIAKYQNICQIKRFLLYNYVYCFPFSITLPIGTVRAPPYTCLLYTSDAADE